MFEEACLDTVQTIKEWDWVHDIIKEQVKTIKKMRLNAWYYKRTIKCSFQGLA